MASLQRLRLPLRHDLALHGTHHGEVEAHTHLKDEESHPGSLPLNELPRAPINELPTLIRSFRLKLISLSLSLSLSLSPLPPLSLLSLLSLPSLPSVRSLSLSLSLSLTRSHSLSACLSLSLSLSLSVSLSLSLSGCISPLLAASPCRRMAGSGELPKSTLFALLLNSFTATQTNLKATWLDPRRSSASWPLAQ